MNSDSIVKFCVIIVSLILGIVASVQGQATQTINHFVVNPDGSIFATAHADRSIRIWQTQDLELLTVITDAFPTATHESDRIFDIAINADSQFLATGFGGSILSETPGCIKIFDINTGEEILEFDEFDAATRLDWHPTNPKLLVSKTVSGFTSYSRTYITIWDVSLQQMVKQTELKWREPYDSASSYGAKWSPDGDSIADADNDRIVLRDTETLETMRIFPYDALSRDNYFEVITDLDWNNDGTLLAAITNFNRVLLWNTADWEIMEIIEIQPDEPRLSPKLTWSPDGSRLAISHDAPGFKVWDVESQQFIGNFAEVSYMFDFAWISNTEILHTSQNDPAMPQVVTIP